MNNPSAEKTRIAHARHLRWSRWFRRTVIAVIALSVWCAATAEDTQLFTSDEYTIRIPSGWQMDVTELMNEDEYMDLGYFWSEGPQGGVVLEAGLYRYPTLKGVSLTAGDDSFINHWADALLEDFAENQPEVIEYVSTGDLVFIILSMEDEMEPSCYAETLCDGTVYCFRYYAYRMMDDEGDVPDAVLTEDEYTLFRQILISFRMKT